LEEKKKKKMPYPEGEDGTIDGGGRKLRPGVVGRQVGGPPSGTAKKDDGTFVVRARNKRKRG